MSGKAGSILLELRFRTLRIIDNLPLCHCVAWNGYLRTQVRPHVEQYTRQVSGRSKLDLKAAGMRSVPADNGLRTLPEGFRPGVAFSFDPEKVDPEILEKTFIAMQTGEAQDGMGEEDTEEGRHSRVHVSPESVRLEAVLCRICGAPWDAAHSCRLDEARIEKEAAILAGRRLRIILRTPLIRSLAMERSKQSQSSTMDAGSASDQPLPEDSRTRTASTGSSHQESRYVDPAWIHSEEGRQNAARILWGIQPEDGTGILEPDCGVFWHKVEYPRSQGPQYMSFNGIVGSLRLESGHDPAFLKRLAAGRYTGLGNNLALGFGTYELEDASRLGGIIDGLLPSPTRGSSLFSLSIGQDSLRTLARHLSDCSGMDSYERADDLRHASDSWCEDFLQGLETGYPGQKRVFISYLKKASGYRRICVQDPKGQLAEKCLAAGLSSSLESERTPLWAESCHSYRKGRDYRSAVQVLDTALQSGPIHGYRLDIASFFDSVSRTMVLDMVAGILWGDSLVSRLGEWSALYDTQGIEGLPQGSSISPILSNLALLPLDHAMEREITAMQAHRSGYLRYADDMILWSRHPDMAAQLTARCRSICSSLGLHFRDDKTLRIDPDQSFEYLGHRLSPGSAPLQVVKNRDEWEAFPCLPYTRGLVLYLTGLVRKIDVDAESLSVEFKPTRENPEPRPAVRYAWKDIARIVIISGAAPTSGIMEQAMRRAVPVAFIDYRGKLTGIFLPEPATDSSLPLKQATRFGHEGFALDASKHIVTAKINASIASIQEWKSPLDGWESLKKTCLLRLQGRLGRIEAATDRDVLLGIEGSAAREYFECFGHLCQPFSFTTRRYHPPEGEVNAMLSFGYSLLYARVAAALKLRGLLPHVGLLHQPHGTHMVLASDVMESLRFVVDRMVIKLIGSGSILPEYFRKSDAAGPGYVVMDWKARNAMVRAFEAAFCEERYTFVGHDAREASWALEETISCLLAAIRLNIPFRGVTM